MNKRIKELAEQATEVSEWLSGNCSPDAPDIEKFAELIVKECAGVAEVSMPIDSHPDDRLTVKNSVLKHFGVEE